jgi:putative ABC transport system permease protein
MILQITLALRYLSGRKLRTILTTLAIVFGVLVVFGMNVLLPAFIRSFQANMMAVAGEVDATITHQTGAPFSSETVDKIVSIDGVRAASGSLNRTITLPLDYFDNDPTKPDRVTALALTGLNLETIQTVRAYPVVEGRFLQAGDRDTIVIHQTLADNLGLKLGDIFTVPAPAGALDLTIVGILPAKTSPGNEELFSTLKAAQDALNMPEQINAIDVNFNTADEANREAILTAIEEEIGSNYQVGALNSGDELLANIRIAQAVLNLMGVLALFMGGFIIFNTFRTIVTERRRDIGMLRAVGASQKTILGLILSESILQGIVGTALGLFLGYLLAVGMIAFIEPLISSFLQLDMGNPVVTPGILMVSVFLGIGTTIIAGIIPALNAGRVTPMEALRPSESEAITKPVKSRTFWAGVIMIAIALIALLSQNIALTGMGGILFFFGLLLVSPGLIHPIAGVFARLAEILFARQGTGHLAARNLTRQPTRAAVTASATMIGLAVVLMATSIVTSLSLGFEGLLKKTLGSDFLLIPPSVMVWGGNVGASPELAEDIRSLDGVDAVSTLRFAASSIDGAPVSLLGIDPINFDRVSGLQINQGEMAQALAEIEAGKSVIANTALAASKGVQVGDEITLVTVDGEQNYHVAAIGTDYMNAKIMGVFISHRNIAEDFGMDEDFMLQVNLKPGIERDDVEPQIWALLEPYPQFNLISGVEYLEQNMALMDTAFAGMYGLLIFMAIPSLIAMINTLAIGVIERTREIGMLRAVGTTRKQIRTVILAEALILAAIGTSFGVAAGLYLGYLGVQALGSAGFPLEYIFPVSGVVAAIVAGLIFGALAAVIPAQQAAKMDVIAALRYE